MSLVRGAASGNVVILGMVNTGATDSSAIGQEFRDSTRIKAMIGHGYNVLTVDDKHAETSLNNHTNTNFCDARRMKKKLALKWGPLNTFNLGHVFLDYFWAPVSIFSFN